MNSNLRDIITNSVGYWERRRIIYNVTLAIVAVASHFSTPEQYRNPITAGSMVGLLILAVVANLLYCAAYIPDVALQYSAFEKQWKQVRIGLFLFGTFFAATITFITVNPLRFN
jgi:hypothetical protein